MEDGIGQLIDNGVAAARAQGDVSRELAGWQVAGAGNGLLGRRSQTVRQLGGNLGARRLETRLESGTKSTASGLHPNYHHHELMSGFPRQRALYNVFVFWERQEAASAGESVPDCPSDRDLPVITRGLGLTGD